MVVVVAMKGCSGRRDFFLACKKQNWGVVVVVVSLGPVIAALHHPSRTSLCKGSRRSRNAPFSSLSSCR